MVLLEGETNGLNIFRDAIETKLSTAQLGSDGTEVTVADTGLGSAITGTSKSVTNTKFDKGIKIDYETSAGDGSGNTAREWAIFDGSSNALARVAFPEIEIESATTIQISSQLILLQEL